MNEQDLERIAAPHASKAAKIRALNEAGVSTSDISTFLGIRYQHTYNVLLRAGRIVRAAAGAEAIEPLVSLHVGKDGVVTLPDSLVEALGLRDGGQLFCRPTPQGLLLIPHEQAIAELRQLAAERMPEHASLLDALLGNKPPKSPGNFDG
jgi:antitoxin component of MazEF toxin-antitoxin module